MASARSSSGNEDEYASPLKNPRLEEPPEQRPVSVPLQVTIGRRGETSSITVRIPEFPSEAIGGHLWPSAHYLSTYFHRTMRTTLRSQHVLELGAGRCLSGIHLALLPKGPRVILTDAATDFVADAHAILALNGIPPDRATAQRLCWGEFTPETLKLKGRVDYIIAADVFYEPSEFELVFVTVSYLARPFLTSYQHRGEGKRRLRQLAAKWRMKMETVDFEMEEDEETGVTAGNQPMVELLLFTPI